MYPAEYDNLIQSIYQGPLEASLWQSFLQNLQKELQAQYVTLLLRPPREGDTGVVLNAVVPFSESYDSYRNRYFSEDAFVDLPVGKAMLLDDVLDRESFQQSQYYKDYLHKAGVEHLLGIDMVDDNGYSARLRITRGAEADNFNQGDKTLVESLIPHLTQAIALYSRIVQAQSQAQAYQDAFDHMDMGCIILDRKLQVQTINKAAEDLLAGDYGLKLRDNCLSVGGAEENRRFKSLVEAITTRQIEEAGSVRAFRIHSQSSVAGLGLLCRALPPASTPDAGPSVAIFISDPQKPRVNRVELLEQLFGLTAAESRLALLLANGLSLDEAAEELGVTRNTAKSHLSASFSKTGVTRQPALVQLILRSVATIG